MKRWARRLLLAIFVFVIALFVLATALRRPGDATLYPARGETIAIHVVDHGYHAGLVLPVAPLAAIAKENGLAHLTAAISVFDHFDRVEIGWGEENFYRYVPNASIAALPHIARALFMPGNRSVLHFVGINDDIAQAFPFSDRVTLHVSKQGLDNMAAAIDAEFRRVPNGDVAPLGPGLYGPSAFFGAISTYHLLNTCNHWIARMLASAGLPHAPVEATLSAGLMFDLRRRAGKQTQ